MGYDASGQTGGSPLVEIQQMQVCTPAVSGLQVNGQQTNTIIAGTSGFISLYGTCLGSATTVQVDGSGVGITSLQYTSDQQVNAFFQASSMAGGGTHNVTVTSVNGTSAPTANSQVFLAKVTLQSFQFTNSVPYYRDCFGPNAPPLISTPTWPAPNTAVCPLSGTPYQSGGDHAVYKSGDGMKGTAVFNLTPAPPMGVTGLNIEGVTSGAGTFKPTAAVNIAGGAGSF
ncbi:MAG: hypothetical protein LC126_30215, partial [Bryobacterales bacterium]|nr:hypothetical protein [Bryobacterales bacterium]